MRCILRARAMLQYLHVITWHSDISLFELQSSFCDIVLQFVESSGSVKSFDVWC